MGNNNENGSFWTMLTGLGKAFLCGLLLTVNAAALIAMSEEPMTLLPTLATGIFGFILHILPVGFGLFHGMLYLDEAWGSSGGRISAFVLGVVVYAPVYLAIATVVNGLGWDQYGAQVILLSFVSFLIFAYLGIVCLIAGGFAFIVGSMMR